MKHLFEGRIVTVPNLLSALRLALIPVILWLYAVREDHGAAAAVFGLSCLTDAADGFIARRLDQVSDLGKLLDPLADKLTQLAVGICLVRHTPQFIPLCAEMAVRDLAVAAAHLRSIRASGTVESARWHGKLATVMIVSVMALHFLWTDIPTGVSAALIGACMGAVFLSGVLYSVQFFHTAKEQ